MNTMNPQTSSKTHRQQMQQHAERMIAVEAFRNNQMNLKEVLAIILK